MAPPKKAPAETRVADAVQTSEFDENVKWLEKTLKRFTVSFPDIQEAASLMSGDRAKHRAELEILVSQVFRQFTGSALEMAKDMKRKFNFVNIAGGAHSELVDVTRTAVFADYEGAAAA